jgi:hypothetical protein
MKLSKLPALIVIATAIYGINYLIQHTHIHEVLKFDITSQDGLLAIPQSIIILAVALKIACKPFASRYNQASVYTQEVLLSWFKTACPFLVFFVAKQISPDGIVCPSGLTLILVYLTLNVVIICLRLMLRETIKAGKEDKSDKNQLI